MMGYTTGEGFYQAFSMEDFVKVGELTKRPSSSYRDVTFVDDWTEKENNEDDIKDSVED